MAIVSEAGYLAAARQRIRFCKPTCVTATFQWQSTFHQAVDPPAQTLAAGNTANGIVPTSATPGYPSIASFNGATGYVSSIECVGADAQRVRVYDRLFVCGDYAFNANVNLTAQPSFAARVPGGDYKGLELWMEITSALTSGQIYTVGYTNEVGAAKSTSYQPPASYGAGLCQRFPLAAGDQGIQGITSVVGSGTAAAVNIMILRPLCDLRMQLGVLEIVNSGLETGWPVVYDTSALLAMFASGGATGNGPTVVLEIASG